MPTTALDLDTIQRLVVVPEIIEGLRKLNNNIWAALGKVDNLPRVHEKIESGASPSIAHPRICSVSRTLLRSASSIVLLAELLIDKAPSELNIDMHLLRKLYPHISRCLATALQEVDRVEFDGGEKGYTRIPEDFLSGPRAEHLPLPRDCTCPCHIIRGSFNRYDALSAPSYFTNVPSYDKPCPTPLFYYTTGLLGKLDEEECKMITKDPLEDF